MARVAVILPAAGRSSRFRDQNYKKPFAPLDGKPVWLHAAERFINRPDVKQTLLVIAAEDKEDFQARFSANTALLGIEVVLGGEERTDSVRKALERVKEDIDLVAVHDAARPCIADKWIDSVLEAAERSGAAILATPIAGTIKRVDRGRSIVETVSREGLWEAQTPQVFRRDLLLSAYARAPAGATDDAQVVEAAGHQVTVVPGSPMNLKITTKDDLRLAQATLKALPKPKLDGPGHPFADNDKWR